MLFTLDFLIFAKLGFCSAPGGEAAGGAVHCLTPQELKPRKAHDLEGSGGEAAGEAVHPLALG